MNKKDLDQLQSKYYRGETTLDEEQMLRNALNDDSVDALLMQELEGVDDEIEVPADLESNLSDMIDLWQDEEQQEAKVTPSLWRRTSWWAAAASVAAIVTMGLWFQRNQQQNSNVGTGKQPPVIAKTTDAPPAPSNVDETPQFDTQSVQEPKAQPQPQPQTASKTKEQPHLTPANAFKNKVEHLAQVQVKPQEPTEPSLSDEELAMEALEKFSTTLNKGMEQLNDAGETIDNINNTINQLL